MMRSAREKGNHHLIHPASLTYPHLCVKDVKESKEERERGMMCVGALIKPRRTIAMVETRVFVSSAGRVLKSL